ncbi:MAG: hypothetical protein VX672_01295, partial [Planctomycetota bacterium]|nr:hypothetical protein [Planctomycetota bacterium]
FIREELLDNGWISENDLSLLEIAKDPADARDRVLRFYRNYQSSRYVGDRFVIRLRRAPSPETVIELQDTFGDLAVDGRFEVGKALSAELVDRHLPRLHYRSRRRDFGGVRRLIDRLNEIDVAPDDPTGTVEVDL